MPPSLVERDETGIYQRRGSDADWFAWPQVDADCSSFPQIKIVESGPLRACVEVRYTDLLISKVYLNRISRQLYFETTFMPKGKRYRVRVAFPTSIRNGRIRHSIPFGYVERPEGEYPAQDWVDYSDNEKGICLLNRGLPGNNITDGVMLLSLFRAVAMEDTDPYPWFEEGIPQTFHYALVPFGKNDVDYNPARLGAQFNRPIYFALVEGESLQENGSKVLEDSLLNVTGVPVELSACRKVDEVIEVRLYESGGRGGKVNLTFSQLINSCCKVDAVGTEIEQIRSEGNNVSLDIRPFEIVTLYVRLSIERC
jgi:alpha-mannosidase